LDLYKQFPAAKKIFEQIDQIARRPLSNLCFDGPAEELKRTINTQSAILAVSLAAWECYCEAGGPQPAFVAGHSLGEFSALYAAKVLSLDSVIRLVEKRGQLMEACPPGAMSAVLGIKFEQLKELCNATSAVVANFNTEEQLVISGDPQSVAQVGEQAKAQGAKVIPLPVGGAFHSPLMSQAAKEFSRALNQYQFSDAQYPVVQNVTALAHTNGTVIKNTLDQQMTNSVLWYTTIKFMLDQGVTHFVEIGPGKVLSGMVKRIDKTVSIHNVGDSASLNATIAALRTD